MTAVFCVGCGKPFTAHRRLPLIYCSAACGRSRKAALAAEIAAESRLPILTREDRRLRMRARWAVRYAVERGLLKRGSCELAGAECSGPVEGHHDDYSQPLEVRWFCRLHHRRVDGWKLRRFEVQPMCNKAELRAAKAARPAHLSQHIHA